MSHDVDSKDLLAIPDPYAQRAARPGDTAATDLLAALPYAPARAEALRLRVGAALAGALFEGAVLCLMRARGGETLGGQLLAVGVALPLLVAGLIFWVLQASLTPWRRVVGVVALGVLVFVATSLATDAPGDTSPGAMLRCAMGGSLMVAGPLLLAVYSMRHSFVAAATWRTAALGLACGLVGAAATRLHCPVDAALHVVVAHGAPVGMAMLLGVLLGRGLLRA